MCAEQTPKRKFEDEIPSNDRLERIMRRMGPNLRNIQSWDLKYQTFLSIVCSNIGIRIHIREFTEDAKGQQFATKKGIAMTLETWFHLTEKIFRFNLVQKETSFVCNNQLLVLNSDGNCIMQQIFKDDPDQFMLRPTTLKLLPDQLDLLKEHVCEISDALMDFQLTTYLPELLMKVRGNQCCFATHEVEDASAMENLVSTLHTEMCKVITRLFNCEGCVIDDPSQWNHECMRFSISEQLFRLSSNCFSLINYYNVVNDLKARFCLCHYTEEFFKGKTMDCFLKPLKEMIDSVK